MNLREANVMREKIADLAARLASLEKRLILVEDAQRDRLESEANQANVFHVEQLKRGPGRPRKNPNDR